MTNKIPAGNPATSLRSVTLRLAVFPLMLFLFACAGNPPLAENNGQTLCTEPRPEVCTMDYNPVCATRADGSTATYPNGCGACADAAVVSHRPGTCE